MSRQPVARAALAAGVVAVAALPLLSAGTLGLAPAESRAAALVLATVGCWATGLLPEAVAALGFFAIAMLADVAAPAVIFSGFASQAFWLVFSGLVLSMAASETGLARRLAAVPLEVIARSYTRVVTAAVLLGLASAFVVPSTMGRVALLVPILLALADRLGLEPGRPGRTGMVMGFILSTYFLPVAVLPANVPNVVLAGAVETVHGRLIGYAEYLILHLPVLALAKAPILVAVLVRLFPDRIERIGPGDAAGPLAPSARLLALVFALTLAGWATDTVHGIAPAWIGLAAALVCLAPGSGILPATVLSGRLNTQPLFYVAAVLGIAGLVSTTDIGAVLSRALLEVLPLAPGADFLNFMSLSGIAALLGFVATMPGVPAVLTPLAGDLATSAGWTLEAVLMTPVVGFSLAFLPYQVPPIVVGLQIAGIPLARAVPALILVNGAALVLLLPLDYLWWRWLGVIG
jgi:di/tricarboxylate transporter